jgi:hypothetical protein
MSCSSESLISSLFLPKISALQIALQRALQQRASTVQATKSTGTHEAEIIAFHPIDVNRQLSLQEPFCARHSAIKNPSRVRSRGGIFCKYLLLAAIACEGMARLQ